MNAAGFFGQMPSFDGFALPYLKAVSIIKHTRKEARNGRQSADA